MGWDIYIGDAYIQYDSKWEDVRIRANQVTQDDAPYWEGGDISGKGNGRFPSYSSMHSFCEETGLYDLFYNKETGILRDHPGVVVLTDGMAQTVQKARERWIENNPDTEPGWGDGNDYTLARLIWYEWWMKWALLNCERPIIENF